MTSVLLTAFEPYGRWKTNASLLCLDALKRESYSNLHVTTLVYPVDFARVRELAPRNLAPNYDVVIHLGQAPGRDRVCLEAFAINVGGEPEMEPDEQLPLCEDGPPAYRSTFPLAQWSKRGRAEELPIQVSHHAGTYLCNATMYWTHYFAERLQLRTQCCFVHLPLATEQIEDADSIWSSLPTTMMVKTVRWLLSQL